MQSAFTSSHLYLALLMGAGAYIGVQHLWFWHSGRRKQSHLWVVAFCASSLAFMAGRLLEVSSAGPAEGVAASRLQAAMAPFLIYSVVGFGRSLNQRPWHSGALLGLLAFSAALAALSYWTPLFVADAPFVDTDWFGHDHHSAPATPAILVFLAYAVAAWARVGRDLHSAPDLHPRERRVLVGAMAVFALMGAFSILSAMALFDLPTTSQFGLIVVAGALSYLLVSEHQRLQVKLEQRVEERTAELQESAAAYRRLVESAPLGIASCSPEGVLLTANPHMMQMMGGLPEESTAEIAGDDALNLLALPHLVDSGMAAMLKQCAENGESSQGDFAFRSPWDIDVELRLHVAPIRDASGTIRAVQAITEETGQRRALEERLRQSKKLEAVGRLAAGIAHEINNPMSYVRANLSMLRGEWSNLRREILERCGPDSLEEAMVDCQELIEESLEGVERTVALVRDVKEFSHSRSERRSEADLNEILEDSLRMASHRVGPEVRVERDYAELPQLSCTVAQLRQIFNNLFDNALHAVGDEGTVRVTTRREGDEVVALIEDDGEGISPEIVEQLFDPFFTTKEAGKGTGLGLYIVYEIVRIHDGSIRVESKPGAGAAFEVRLPLTQQSGDDEGP